jgi:hypothetical protein
MRVLLMETDRHAGDDAARRLQAARHEVVRCHEPGAAAFPCNALSGVPCPLDQGAPVDVALTVRAHPHPRPSSYEDGVTCALRRFVPLVVAGRAALSPFERWSTTVADGTDDVVDACERAASSPIAPLSVRAEAAAVEALTTLGYDPRGASAVVHRAAGRLVVDVTLPEDSEPARGATATHVHRAVAALAPMAPGIDVRVNLSGGAP